MRNGSDSDTVIKIVFPAGPYNKEISYEINRKSFSTLLPHEKSSDTGSCWLTDEV